MITLLETPVPIILFGIITLAVLGLMLLRSGRGVLLWVMIGVAVLVAGGIALERVVVTERERIEAVIEAGAAAVAVNDKEAALRHVDPNNRDTRSLVAGNMGRFKFTGAKITRLEISFKELSSPPRATAKIMVLVSFDSRDGSFPHDNYPVPLTLHLWRKGDTWLIEDHEWKNNPSSR
ncbi:MAG: hypothetical protein HQ567_19910 [Candidatus Nealsonbacteria bacterium]|nr:hypothetical protein [Candidatus Nealsonbacteria bacterium]